MTTPTAIPDIVLYNVRGRPLALLNAGMAVNDTFRTFRANACKVVRPSGGSAGVAFDGRGDEGEYYYPLVFVDAGDPYVRKDTPEYAAHIASVLCQHVRNRHLIITLVYNNNDSLLSLLQARGLMAQSLPLKIGTDGQGEKGFLDTPEDVSEALSVLWRQLVSPSTRLANEPWA